MEDFEKLWLNRISNSLSRHYGANFRMETLKAIKKTKSPLDTTRKLMKTFEKNLPEKEIHNVLTEATCLYPRNELLPLKKIYEKNGDLEEVHSLLQKKFEKDIVKYKSLSISELKYIKRHHWGVAGRLDGNTIHAIKIPAEFHRYFQSFSKDDRNSKYCHCPRIKESIKNGEQIPYKYCYCGGGYYRDIWKTITGKEVTVSIEQSILKGDDVCEFKINISE